MSVCVLVLVRSLGADFIACKGEPRVCLLPHCVYVSDQNVRAHAQKSSESTEIFNVNTVALNNSTHTHTHACVCALEHTTIISVQHGEEARS